MNIIRHPRHYAIALDLIASYDGKVPLPIYLSHAFKQNRQWGGKDRKAYRDLVYTYFKYAEIFRITATDVHLETLKAIDSGNIPTDFSPYRRFQDLISDSLRLEDIKPWFLEIPPFFFLSWESKSRLSLMERGGVLIAHDSFEFPAGTDLTDLLIEGKGIIQDISSTEIIVNYTKILNGSRIWDCCSGAGGKSLTLQNRTQVAKLYCSDIRENILENLRTRFKQNGQSIPELKVIDLENLNQFPWLKEDNLEVILADVPCTGSGTWRRNPERLAFFQDTELEKFTLRQRAILRNLVMCNPKKGILYITCSLFKEENEGMVDWFVDTFKDYTCQEWHYHGKINEVQKGDILFSAWLTPR